MLNVKPYIIRRGLDIPIEGAAEPRRMSLLDESLYAVRPDDYVGMIPRLLVNEGDSVLVGTALVGDKGNEACRLVSPVSGTVKTVVRGEKRRLIAVVVESDGMQKREEWTPVDIMQCGKEELRKQMIETGLWSLLIQRPFGIVPQGDACPKALFLSGFDSNPLPVDTEYLLQGREEDFRFGIRVLRRFVDTVHLSLDMSRQRNSWMANIEEVEVHYFEGPHPAGLVGTQINRIAPINKGETVWTTDLQSVAIIGHYFRTGELDMLRRVALCGPVVPHPCYFDVRQGVRIVQLAGLIGDGQVRYVGGELLSGIGLEREGYMPVQASKLCVLPEGDQQDLLGWLRPNIHKYSHSRTFLSGFLNRRKEDGERNNYRFKFDTGLHGGNRPLFVTGEFERLVPLDIYPMQLIKACIVGDLELMEELGIYEVEPEDLALCEFADTSKTEIQKIVRQALEQLRREG